MERTELNDDLIDLGAISVETKGQGGDVPEFSIEQLRTGLADD